MENRKYVVCRNAVCAGRVLKIDKDFGFINCRSMLFVPTEENMANDLLYQSNFYPILEGKTDDLIESQIFIVKDIFHLDEILKYFGYGENLTYMDILKIRKTIFSNSFIIQNFELFGWKKIGINEQININPACLEFHRKGYHMFVGASHGALPRGAIYHLDRLSDHLFEEYVKNKNNKMNAFTPSKEEGPIKKLKR